MILSAIILISLEILSVYVDIGIIICDIKEQIHHLLTDMIK